MENNYCIITEGERVRARLLKEGIDSVCMYFDNETAVDDIKKLSGERFVIIIGGRPIYVRRVGQELTHLGVSVRCYTTDVRNSDILNEPLSSIINTEDADKIERITRSFALNPFVL